MVLPASSVGAPDLCCPSCGEVLQKQHDALRCTACRCRWPFREGIASFCEGEYQAADDVGAQVQAVLRHAAEKGWEEALHQRFPRENPAGYWHVYDPPCADWFHLGSVDRRDLAVSLGVGWGALPMRLARLFDHVVAVDWVWERLRFSQGLLAHEGLENITFLHAGPSASALPPEIADLVVLNGELECAAFHGEEADAEAAQRAVLSGVLRLLRPGGSLCLGASNRFAAPRLMGRRDHGRPAWAGVLPRPLRDVYGAVCREPARHALSHSPAGYHRLLTAAGLSDVQSYVALPSHHHPRLLVPRGDPATLTWVAKLSLARRGRRLGVGARLVHRLASSRMLARAGCLFCDSLVIWARRPEAPTDTRAVASRPAHGAALRRAGLGQALKDRLLDEWQTLGLDTPVPRSISIVQLSGNWDRGGKVNWFVFPDRSRQPALVAKVSRTPADAGRMDHEHRALLWLRSLPPEVSDHVARPLARWEIDGHLITLQQHLPWPPLTVQVTGEPPETAVPCALGVVLPFLTQLASIGRQEHPKGAGNPCLAALLEGARRAASVLGYTEATRELLWGLAGVAREALDLSFTVPHHGDISTADILVVGERQFHVLDWEWSEREGLPLLDLVTLGLSAASRHDSSALVRTIRSLAMLPPRPGETPVELDDLVNGYCDALGLPRAWRRAMVAAALLNALLRTPECRISHLILSLPDESDELIVSARALLAGEQAPADAPVLQSLFHRMRG